MKTQTCWLLASSLTGFDRANKSSAMIKRITILLSTSELLRTNVAILSAFPLLAINFS